MRSKLSTILILMAFLPASISARDEPERIRRTDLANRSFVVGDLKIIVKRFWAGSLLTRGYIEVRAENRSSNAATFNPQRLSFVGKDGKQVNIRGRRQTGPVHPDDREIEVAQPREIAPGAYVK